MSTLETLLRQRKLLTKFKKNVLADENNRFHFKQFGKQGTIRHFLKQVHISGAFVWSKTPEGHDFWRGFDNDLYKLT